MKETKWILALVAVAVGISLSFHAQSKAASEGSPLIKTLRPGSSEPRRVVRILGSGFGEVQGESLLHFGEGAIAAGAPDIKSWSDTKISLKVPHRKPEWFLGESLRVVSIWVTVGGSDSNKKPLKVINPAYRQDHAPVAEAGENQTVSEHVTVELDGSHSTDPDGNQFIVSYLWEQIDEDGPMVVLSDETAVKPTFIAPAVDEDGAVLTFRLTVQDYEGFSSTDEVAVEIVKPDGGEVSGFSEDFIPVPCATEAKQYLGIKGQESTHMTALFALDPATITETKKGKRGMPEQFIYGLLQVQARVDEVGSTAAITVQLPEPVPAGYRWYKYNETEGWFDFGRDLISQGAGDGAEISVDGMEVTLYITDGGPYDDNAAEMIVADPSGLGGATQTTSSNESGGDSGGDGGGGCFIETLRP